MPLSDENPNQLAFEQTLRGLDRQRDVMDQLRSRTGIVLSGTGIIASLLGSQALQGRYSLALALVALGSTALGILLCVGVLWPVHDEGKLPRDREALPGWNRWPTPKWKRRREWQVTVPRDVVRDLRGESNVSDKILDALDLARRANYLTIERRSKAFGWACLVLGVQLVLWASVLLAESSQTAPAVRGGTRPGQAAAGARALSQASLRAPVPVRARISAS
jgi:hypothetical protein